MSGERTRIAALAAVTAMGWVSGAVAQQPAGDWHGVLTAPGGQQLRIGLTLKAKAGGGYDGVLASPDQGGAEIPIDEVKVEGGTISFSVPVIAGHYKGRWDEAQHAWIGEWRQDPAMPLTLTTGKP